MTENEISNEKFNKDMSYALTSSIKDLSNDVGNENDFDDYNDDERYNGGHFSELSPTLSSVTSNSLIDYSGDSSNSSSNSNSSSPSLKLKTSTSNSGKCKSSKTSQIKTSSNQYFKKSSLRRVKIKVNNKNSHNNNSDNHDSNLVTFVKSAFTAFGNNERDDFESYFSPNLKCTINSLPYSLDGLKDALCYITGSWTQVEIDFKYIIEHPRLMGANGEGEVGAVAELVGTNFFGQDQRVKCLFTMVVDVKNFKQEIREWHEIMTFD